MVGLLLLAHVCFLGSKRNTVSSYKLRTSIFLVTSGDEDHLGSKPKSLDVGLLMMFGLTFELHSKFMARQAHRMELGGGRSFLGCAFTWIVSHFNIHQHTFDA